VLTAAGVGAELQDVNFGSSERQAYQPLPGFISFSTSPSPLSRGHRLSYGFFLFWPIANTYSTRLVDDRTVDQQNLPSNSANPLDLDALFPDGITRSENSAGVGELRILTLGSALGYEASEWLRMGLSVRWERVQFSEISESSVVFSAAESPETAGELTGFRHTSYELQGELERLVYSVGLQVDLGRHFTAGMTYRLPSRSHNGNGSFGLAQSSGLQVGESGVVLTDTQEFSLITADNLPFTLKLPGEIKLGVAMRLQSFSAELDWTRSQRLGAYQVFPSVSSDPVSTQALQIDATETSLNEVDHYAVGLAFSAGETVSLLFGYAQDNSAVPADDSLYRRVDFETVSGGYYFTRGGFSGSAGLAYRFARESGVVIPELGGDTPLSGSVSIKILALMVGGSYIF
jgi:long-subunit fatty acid transport protein